MNEKDVEHKGRNPEHERGKDQWEKEREVVAERGPSEARLWCRADLYPGNGCCRYRTEHHRFRPCLHII